MAGFDITEMLKSVPKSGTMAQLRLIPFDKIKPDKGNGYSMDGLEELAGNIETVGLLDPLVVLPEQDGVFPLISGHRRLAAIKLILLGGSGQFAEGIPCIVRAQRELQEGEDPQVTELLDRLSLLMANSDNRKKTPADDLREATGFEEIVAKLADLGFEFPGRRRDWVAKISGMSKSKLSRLKVIKDGLTPQWRELFDKGKLREETAYEIARQPEWIQERIRKVKPDALADAVRRIGKLMQDGNDYRCEALTGPGCAKCTHGDAFLRHDLEDCFSPCEGEKCCLKCEKSKRDSWPCDRMCSKAKARRSDANKKEKERQATAEEQKKRQLMAEITESARRLLKAADAAGVSDETEIKSSGRYYSSKTVGWCRKALAGENIGAVYRNEIAATELDVAAVAKALHCSADYIVGLTDELGTADEARAAETPIGPAGHFPQRGKQDGREISLKYLGYLTCDPPDGLKCWTKFMDEDTRDFTMLATYSAEQAAWFAGSEVSVYGKIDQRCIGWWPIPDDSAPDLPADLRPAEPALQSWQTGKPSREAYYAVRLQLYDKTLPAPRILWWDGEGWINSVGDDIRQRPIDRAFHVLGWCPLPEVET